MKVEHVAFVVRDPLRVARWYCENLGMRIARHGGGGDIFVADAAGLTVFQFEDGRRVFPDSKGGGPNYASQDPRVLHLGLCVDDVAAARQRLVAAGATSEGEVIVTADGDEIAMVRDPWGLPLQLTKRKEPLL